MLDTEYIKVFLTFTLKLASLRPYAGECHDCLYPCVEAVLLPPELIAVFTPHSPDAHPVQPWPCNQLNDTAGICAASGSPIFRVHNPPLANMNGIMPKGAS